MTRHDPWARDEAKRALGLLAASSRVSPELRQAVAEVEQEIDLLRTVVRELATDKPPTWMIHSRADEAYWRAFEEVGMEPPDFDPATTPATRLREASDARGGSDG